VLVDFNRREALVRFDPQGAGLQILTDAVGSAGGYQAALKYGPIVAEKKLDRLANQSEYRMPDAERIFAHTGMRILPKEQVEKTIRWMERGNGARPEWYTEQNLATHTFVFVSFWSKHREVLPVNWDEQVTLKTEKESITPMGWISLAERTESDGIGSIAGIICFPHRREYQSSSVSLRFTGLPDGRDREVVLNAPISRSR